MALTLHTILSPVDFGEASEHSLSVALDLAALGGGRVHALHVYQIPVYGFPDGAFLTGPEVAARLSEASQRGLDLIVERYRARGIPLDSSLRQGNPAEEIVACGGEIAASVIVLGTHGRGAIAHALLGSVTERVIRTSNIPVLTIRHTSRT